MCNDESKTRYLSENDIFCPTNESGIIIRGCDQIIDFSFFLVRLRFTESYLIFNSHHKREIMRYNEKIGQNPVNRNRK